MPEVRAESERSEAMRRFVDSKSADIVIHAMSIRLAKACREVIQSLLREEEWADCDLEFYQVVRAGLEELEAALAGMRGRWGSQSTIPRGGGLLPGTSCVGCGRMPAVPPEDAGRRLL